MKDIPPIAVFTMFKGLIDNIKSEYKQEHDDEDEDMPEEEIAIKIQVTI